MCVFSALLIIGGDGMIRKSNFRFVIVAEFYAAFTRCHQTSKEAPPAFAEAATRRQVLPATIRGDMRRRRDKL
jgi:hypothetical protein